MDIGQDGTFHHSDSSLHDVGLDELGRVPEVRKGDESESNANDQLPNVEEYKTNLGIGSTKANKMNLKIALIVAGMISVASVLIALGVVIGRDTAGPSKAAEPAFIPDSPEPLSPITPSILTNNSPLAPVAGYQEIPLDAPVASPLASPLASPSDVQEISGSTGRLESVVALVSNMGWSETAVVNTAGTPQWKAAQWMANTDPQKLPVAVSEEFMNRYVLATVYYALGGPEWTYQLNWMTEKAACEWNTHFNSKVGIKVLVGATCHSKNSIEEIFLPSNKLSGSLPKELGMLMDLRDLNLYENQITGVLPETMKKLKSLRILILHDNSFEGPIPDWIGSLSSLTTLNLSDNRFKGNLPATMGTLPLTTLALERNSFSGPLDPLKGLAQLKSLYLGDNEFSGTFLNEVFMSWIALEILDISDNDLRGSLPEMLIAKEYLIVVDLHGNNFSGGLPNIVEIGDSVEFLALHDNQLTGPVDSRLNGLTELKHLDLSKNFFTGAMPTSLGNLKSLRYLYLAYNAQFDAGPVPVEYASLPDLVDLSLQKTNRNGKIPFQLENAKNLVLLDLNENDLTGTIPPELEGIATLKFLMLKDNKLTGSIPGSLSQLQQLETILLDGNSITSGSETFCSPKLPLLKAFVADCEEMTSCSCCTTCCTDGDKECNPYAWVSNLDPVADGNYIRDSYEFAEADLIFPVVTPDNHQPLAFYQNYTGYYRDSVPVPP